MALCGLKNTIVLEVNEGSFLLIMIIGRDTTLTDLSHPAISEALQERPIRRSNTGPGRRRDQIACGYFTRIIYVFMINVSVYPATRLPPSLLPVCAPRNHTKGPHNAKLMHGCDRRPARS
jgi:hypothetical protein